MMDALPREPKKGVTSSEMLWGDACDLRSRDTRIGLPIYQKWYIILPRIGNPLNGNILVRGGKENKSDFLSNGE